MNILFETDHLKLEHEYEMARLIDKGSGVALMEEEFYGDPSCGLIQHEGLWAIVAGEYLIIWTPEKMERLAESGPKWIHAMRPKGNEHVEILTDPWGEDPAVWTIKMQNLALNRIRDFPDYRGKPYTEEVLW